MPKTIFQILNDVTFNKVPWDDQSLADQKSVQPYMIQRWLSMNPVYLEIVSEVQPTVQNMPPEHFYEFYRKALPKNKFWAKYIKKNGKSVDNHRLIQLISKVHLVPNRDAVDIINLNTRSDLINFVESLGLDKKEYGL